MNNNHRFDEKEREGVYRAIYERRDIRSHFISDPIPDEVLGRLLDAAHHAPSVGFIQPWSFVLVRDVNIRRQVHDLFSQANHAASEIYTGERKANYQNLKLAGILDSYLNICVLCDSTSSRGHGLGRQTMPETVPYSTVCAIQNLWLAARAEGIGVGWVSIIDPEKVRELLGIPPELLIVGYLCVGYVSQFDQEPDLQRKGWERRASLPGLVHFDRYGAVDEQRAHAMLDTIGPAK